jgi:diketogulonate reductase-like aldo/keto reductase
MNEEAIGKAVTAWLQQGEGEGEGDQEQRRRREDLFIATKISRGESHGYEECLSLVERQLKDLGTDYIDLYYIHGYPQVV